MKYSAILFSALLLCSISSWSQNTSYNANTVPVGGLSSTAFGVSALHFNTESFNTASGYASQYNITGGKGNVATGAFSLYSSTMGIGNTAMGHMSMLSTNGSYNTAQGYYSLFSNSTGTYNTAGGYNVLYTSTTGNSNTAYGNSVMYSNTSGSNNSAFGDNTLYNNTTGNLNTAIGEQALWANTTGNENTAIGDKALLGNQTGFGNTGISPNALHNNHYGSYNTVAGGSTFNQLIGNSYNTGVGAGIYDEEISNVICMGYNSGFTANINCIRAGSADVTSIGGQVGWTIYSDARVKNNLKEDVPGLSFISLLRPVTYHYNITKENELIGNKNDTMQWPEKKNIEKIKFSGFIAQEVDAAAQKIGYNFSGVDKAGKIMGLRYADFVVPLVKAVQEQQQQIDELRSMVAASTVAGTTIELSNKNAVALNQNTPNLLPNKPLSVLVSRQIQIQPSWLFMQFAFIPGQIQLRSDRKLIEMGD